ncbi:MAG: Transcriptional regulatory protein ZraR [Prosthecobacter sp.]|nr:Transcriptional regulatory protein ZraR [Prosthecobacter sp.]
MPSVLIIEDEYALAAALATIVRRLGAEPVVAASGQSGLDKARRQAFDVVLLDIGLPDMSGLKVLAGLRQQASPPEVLIITAHGSLENALEARRLGAREYFLKPLNLGEMQTCLRSLLGNGEERRTQVGAVSAEGAGEHTIMIGAAPGMQRAFAAIAQACSNTAPVLLSGPRGSGTTLAARVIHRNSSRSAGPLVVFRADEWPATGQETALQLACDKAAGGSLLVEEVASLSLPLQGLLARLSSASEGVGDKDMRLLVTTAAPLAEEIAAGRFREDLFYQVAVLQVSLPPLAERVEDVPALAAYLLGCAAPGREFVLAPETLACLKAHAWPGNVRELAAAMRHAAAVCAGSTVLPRHLPDSVSAAGQPDAVGHLDEALKRVLSAWMDQKLTGPEAAWPDYDTLLAHVEKNMLESLLLRFEDKPTRLAAALNMNRATLRRKLRELLGRE